MSSQPSRQRIRLHAVLLGLVVAVAFLPTTSAQPVIPILSGRVVDAADVLDPAAEQEITDLLRDHEQQTGNQVAVLTIESLDGAMVEEYALAVAREWRLGTAENNNGVLLLLAIGDREMRIEVGYGLEGSLPDAVASRILRNEVRPHLRQGDYSGGVRAGVVAILSAIDGAYEPSEVAADRPPVVFGLLFLILPSIFVFLGIMSTGCSRWFLFVFLMPFFWVAGLSITGSPVGAALVWAFYVVAYIVLQAHPKVRSWRETLAEKGSVRVGPVVIGGGGSGGSFGGFSGGGFSGGGGSFGGGGASGSW